MNRLLTTVAVAALLGLATGAALAEEGMNTTGGASDHDVVGSVSIHDVWSDVDVGAFDDDVNTIGGEFAIAQGLGGGWKGQVDAGFNSAQFDVGSIDFLRAGLGAFHEGGNSRFGIAAGYDSVDFGTRDDGWDIDGAGEFYLSHQLTLAGSASYINISGSGLDGDGWGLDGKGTYYAGDRLSLALHLSYLDFEFDGTTGSSEVFGIGAELDWLCPDLPLSFQASLRYDDMDFVGGDGDGINIGAGLKWRFNTDGSLVEQDRSGTFAQLSAAAALLRGLAF